MELYDQIVLGVFVVAIVAAVVFTWGTDEKSAAKAKQDLDTQGYAVRTVYEKNRGHWTQIWGRYPEPLPWYLNVSNRDLIASVAGRLGVADLTVGHEAFDRAFVVRSNKPEWAREFLTEARCTEMLAHESIQFLTTSVGNYFPPAYWPNDRNRKKRDVWMLVVKGKVAGDALAPYVPLAQRWAKDVQQFCAGRPAATDDYEPPFLEGR